MWCHLPFCVLIGFSFDGDASSDTQTFNQVTSEGNTLQKTFHQHKTFTTFSLLYITETEHFQVYYLKTLTFSNNKINETHQVACRGDHRLEDE